MFSITVVEFTITHLKPRQCGVHTINGDITNPYNVFGTHISV